MVKSSQKKKKGKKKTLLEGKVKMERKNINLGAPTKDPPVSGGKKTASLEKLPRGVLSLLKKK